MSVGLVACRLGYVLKAIVLHALQRSDGLGLVVGDMGEVAGCSSCLFRLDDGVAVEIFA